MKTALLGAFLLSFGLCCARAQTPSEPRILQPTESHFVGVPTFSFDLPSACDKEGNMYFHVGDPSRIQILRLSADGEEGKIFKVSDQFEGASQAAFGAFSVTPGGELYIYLGLGRQQDILTFDGDGALSGPKAVDLPKGVIGTSIVPSDAGPVLLFGFYDETAEPAMRGKPYLVVLSRAGRVARELDVSFPGLDVAKLVTGDATPPATAAGEDGNFYIADPKQILVISQAGEVVRKIPFDNPDPGSTPAGILTGGNMAAVFLLGYANRVPRKSMVVVETSTGGIVGYYQPSDDLKGAAPVCLSPRRGLTFISSSNGRTKLIQALLR